MTFVLVPGAGGRAWYWHRVVAELESRGHEAVAVDLPADDDTAGLEQYADRIAAAATGRRRIVLVAQSMGGLSAPLVCGRVPVSLLVLVNAMIPRPGETGEQWWEVTGQAQAAHDLALGQGRPITHGLDPTDVFFHDVPAEARPDAVDTLVYLTAFVPPDGATVMDLAERDPHSMVLQNLVVDEASGHATIRPDAIAAALYHDCPIADRQLAGSLLRPEPLGTLGAPVATTESGFGRVRRVYISCRQDQAITPSLQEVMYTDVPCERVLTLDTGHSPFFSAPADLAEQLVVAAAPAHAA